MILCDMINFWWTDEINLCYNVFLLGKDLQRQQLLQ